MTSIASLGTSHGPLRWRGRLLDRAPALDSGAPGARANRARLEECKPRS